MDSDHHYPSHHRHQSHRHTHHQQLVLQGILKTQNQHKSRGAKGVHRLSLSISFQVSWQREKFVAISECHFESALMSNSLSFTIGSRLILQTVFNEKSEDVLLSANNLFSKMHWQSLSRRFPARTPRASGTDRFIETRPVKQATIKKNSQQANLEPSNFGVASE